MFCYLFAQIVLRVHRPVQPAAPVIHQSAPPKNDSHLIKLVSGEPTMSVHPDLKSVSHVALYLTLTSSEDDEPDKVRKDYRHDWLSCAYSENTYVIENAQTVTLIRDYCHSRLVRVYFTDTSSQMQPNAANWKCLVFPKSSQTDQKDFSNSALS